MGQDPKTDMKAKNQDQLENRREEYLRTRGHFEVFKNCSGENTHGKPSNSAKLKVRLFASNGQDESEILRTHEMN